MSSEEVVSGEEYEVESIRQAKVVRGKQGRKDWSYFVKWKNYSNEDNTWEPPDSFIDGSEHFIHEFWLRVNTGARDWRDLSRFKLGDELFPTGPPRMRSKPTPKKPRENTKASSPSTMEPSDESEDEVNSIIGDDDRPKRKRRSSDVLESSSSKRRRSRKSEVQEEDLQTRARSIVRRNLSMPRMSSATTSRSKASGSVSRRKPTYTRKSPSRSPALTSRRDKRVVEEDSTPDEILLQPTPKSRSRKSKRTPTDVAVEQEIEFELQYPSDPSLLGGSTAGAQEPDPSVFGIPILLIERAELPQPAFNTTELTASVPPHRSRKARVQRYEDPLLGAGETSGIPAKAKFMQQNGAGSGSHPALQADVSPSTGPIRKSTRPRVPSARAGPGRSSSGMVTGSTSLLTATKGTLRTIKGKVFPARRARENEQDQESGNEDESSAVVDGSKREPEVVEPPLPPPTGQELLRQAGYNAADAQDLPDFEDDIDAHGEPDPDHPQPPQEAANEQSNTIVAEQMAENVQEDTKGKTIPDVGVDGQASAQGDTTADVHSNASEAAPERSFQGWRVSTIFGPFGIGRETMPAKQEEQAEDTANASPIEESANHLFLGLDYTISVPVCLKDNYPPGSQLENQAIQPNPGPPGKFYKNEHVPAVLQTLRTQGSTARLVLDAAADESHRQHFARFCSRLHAGELFVEMIGVKLFAMFSSENRALGERLLAPANLLGLSDTVLVAQVAIENHSGYADVVAFADNTQWSAA